MPYAGQLKQQKCTSHGLTAGVQDQVLVGSAPPGESPFLVDRRLLAASSRGGERKSCGLLHSHRTLVTSMRAPASWLHCFPKPPQYRPLGVRASRHEPGQHNTQATASHFSSYLSRRTRSSGFQLTKFRGLWQAPEVFLLKPHTGPTLGVEMTFEPPT